MLFAAMTHRGSVFWADFLDLQAQGPVPWRREIGDAIQSASKFVAVIDVQYLLSFNCLEVRIRCRLNVFFALPLMMVVVMTTMMLMMMVTMMIVMIMMMIMMMMMRMN